MILSLLFALGMTSFTLFGIWLLWIVQFDESPEGLRTRYFINNKLKTIGRDLHERRIADEKYCDLSNRKQEA